MLICQSCRQENQPGARFCNGCGAALAPIQDRGETRKTVTALFCDLTGSTALGEQTDPEILRALLARYFECMKAIVESHGGTVEKFIGDAVMAVFGIPAAHEDDALRACRAAVEMRDALPEPARPSTARAARRTPPTPDPDPRSRHQLLRSIVFVETGASLRDVGGLKAARYHGGNTHSKRGALHILRMRQTK